MREYLLRSQQARPLNNTKIYGHISGGGWGGADQGVQKFWRNLFAGCAAARFHRPPSGIGLSPLAAAHIRAARMFAEAFDFARSAPDGRHTRLKDREPNEAYLMFVDGEQDAVYFPNGGRQVWELFYDSLRRWLRSLPTPLGLMAANDKRARQALEACRLAGLRVPLDVAVIGVDNDEMICDLSDPTLSSVKQGCDEMGYQAAAILDAMMKGLAPTRREIVVRPEGVVTRQSTDVVAVEDVRVARALELIRDHACEGWKVEDVAKALNISRSTLENHFKAALHRTVAEEPRRIRLEKVRGLLADSELPLKQIAVRGGFRSIQHMTSVFHQYYGETPAHFRRGLPRWTNGWNRQVTLDAALRDDGSGAGQRSESLRR